MQAKKKTKNIKVRDLKPKKDAKGGMLVAGSTGHGIQGSTGHGIQGSTGHGIQGSTGNRTH
jgi:hypothetical protein